MMQHTLLSKHDILEKSIGRMYEKSMNFVRLRLALQLLKSDTIVERYSEVVLGRSVGSRF